MQKRFLQKCSLLGVSALLMLTLGCRKEPISGIDNGSVIKTPYSLYAGNTSGKIIQSNDGETFRFVFPSDGYGPTHIVTANNNLLMLKDNLHMSRNQGKSFNPVHTNVRKFGWQSMLYYHAPFKRLYVTSNNGRGIDYSEDFGETFQEDIFEPNLPSLFEIGSFAGLENGMLYAYSNVSNVVFFQAAPNLNWTPMPSVAAYPTLGSEYYLISTANTLYLIDYMGKGGVWISTDGASTWTRIFNNLILPSDVKYTGAVAPLGNNVVVVATETEGIYRSDESGLFQTTTGLPRGTKVRNLTKKINIYKNDQAKIFIYAATDRGIYRSEDHGKTWFLSGGEDNIDDYSVVN